MDAMLARLRQTLGIIPDPEGTFTNSVTQGVPLDGVRHDIVLTVPPGRAVISSSAVWADDRTSPDVTVLSDIARGTVTVGLTAPLVLPQQSWWEYVWGVALPPAERELQVTVVTRVARGT